MFIAGGVLLTVLRASLLQCWSMGKMLFGTQGVFLLQYGKHGTLITFMA